MSKINIDKTIYHSKPSDGNRMAKEMATYDLLEILNIPFLRLDHDATDTIEDCEEVDSLLEIELCKNLFLCNGSKSEFYLLMMPGKKKFVTKLLTKQIGCSRLSFASADYMEKFLNISPGSVSVLGLMFDSEHKVKLLIDKELIDKDFFGCHPCVNTTSLKIKTSDLLTKFLPYTEHDPLIVEL